MAKNVFDQQDKTLDWLDQQGIGSGPITDVEELGGGTQNILIAFTRSDKRYVLRRPPLHKRASSDESMRREARVLAALVGSEVPHPTLFGACADETLLGHTFFVMQAVDGFTATTEVPQEVADSAAWQHAMGLGAVDALLALSRVNPDKVALRSSEQWLERQVSRWSALYESHSKHEGWNRDSLPGIDSLSQWLDSNRPSHSRTGLIHGDFHFGNIMFSRDGYGVAAIVDWELATLGDPLLDLGQLLATWPTSEDPRTTGTAVPLPGLPSKEDIAARYIAATGRSATDVRWFRVLACFRLAVLIEGTNARAISGLASIDVGERLHQAATFLIEQAIELIHDPKEN